MKIKETNSDLTEKSPAKVKSNGTIEKKNKKKKENFEVRVPRIIVRNLNFKVNELLFFQFRSSFKISQVNEDRLKKAFEDGSTPITNVSIVTRGQYIDRFLCKCIMI